MKRRMLHDLAPIRKAHDYLREVLQCFGWSDRSHEGAAIADNYHLALMSYQGKASGYLESDTPYHDFPHVAETFLAMARLLHGACLSSQALSPREAVVGLTAALLHDIGYLRKTGESADKGAVFHSEHEARSMAYVAEHRHLIGLDPEEADDCQAMIQCTAMAQDIDAMTFRGGAQELMARMLSAADLLAQLSSPVYLEKLTGLYAEDCDSNARRYEDRLDCFRKAVPFDELARNHIHHHLEQTDDYLTKHFSVRWNTPANLYWIAMDRQIHYLSEIIASADFDYRRHLRRWMSLDQFRRMMVNASSGDLRC